MLFRSLINHLAPVDLAAAPRVFSELAALAATYPEDAVLEALLMRAVALIGHASIERDLPLALQIGAKYGQRFANWFAARDQREAAG